MPECCTCLDEKPATEFWKNQRRCKACQKALRGKADSAYAKSPKRKAALDRYMVKNRDRHRARVAVHNALRDGKLERQPCELCSSELNLEAHHPDYSKPLEVIWLCTPCHKNLHMEEANDNL